MGNRDHKTSLQESEAGEQTTSAIHNMQLDIHIVTTCNDYIW